MDDTNIESNSARTRTTQYEDERKHEQLFALLASVVVIAVALTVPIFSGVKLGEWGGFIGGLASALGFIWIVLSYRQQNRELKAQLEEFTDSVIAQEKLADANIEMATVAKQQFLAMKEQESRKRPSFEVLNLEPHDKHTVLAYLSPVGGPIRHLSAIGDNEKLFIQVQNTEPLVTPGQRATVVVRTKEGQKPREDLPRGFGFTLRYKDLDGHSFEQRIQILDRESGRWEAGLVVGA